METNKIAAAFDKIRCSEKCVKRRRCDVEEQWRETPCGHFIPKDSGVGTIYLLSEALRDLGDLIVKALKIPEALDALEKKLREREHRYYQRFEEGWHSRGVYYHIDILEGPCCRHGKRICVGRFELLVVALKELFRR